MNDDLISRQAAINLIHEGLDWQPYIVDPGSEVADTVEEILNEVPRIQPKTGHWIVNDDYDGEVYYTCSECKEPWVTIEGTPQENRMRYCPYCGARMEVIGNIYDNPELLESKV